MPRTRLALNRLNHIPILFLIALAIFVQIPRCGNAQEVVRPNVVVIVADDLGYGDLGFQGGTDIPTPHLNSLATTGTRCTNAYVSCPVCSPTRAGLLTGRYQQRFGHEFNPGPQQNAVGRETFGLPSTEVTLANQLKAVGYKTGLVGNR